MGALLERQKGKVTMTGLIKKSGLFLIVVLLGISPLDAGEPLKEDDFGNLRKQRTIEHVLFESYLETDEGLASVFGYHFDTFLTDSLYLATAIFGAVGGERGGYGIAAVGLGHRINLFHNLDLDLKFLVGSGGGGGLPAGGGFALEAQGGLSYEIFKKVYIDVKGGYLKFPSGTFETPIVHAGISFETDRVILPFL